MIFIRPFILLLILVPLFVRIVKNHRSQTTAWSKWVDKKLLPYLLVSSNNSEKKKRYWGLAVLWSLFVIAAAGPAFQQLPVPISQELPNTVIIFDLGPTMQASTLAAAKIKMHDLLTALKGNRVALVLYADQGYVALPLTEDRALVRSLIPTLDPSVLPNTIQKPAAAFQKATELLDQTGGKGRILYLTAGGVDARDIKTPYPIGVLGLDDKAISTTLKQLGNYQTKTPDASDILSLLKATEPSTTVQFDDQGQTDTWADLGGTITLCLLPFLVLTFRRGWLFLLLFGYLVPAHASFFVRSDQEVYKQHIQAVENYRNGEYEKALSGFQNHPYNMGNTLAHMGKIQEAIQSYENALKENPNDEDARFNKEYLEKQLPPPEQNKQQNNEQEQSAQDQKNGSEKEDQQQNDQNQNKADQNQQQSENEKSSQEADQKQNEQQYPQQNEQDSQQPQEIEEADKEQQPFTQDEQKLLNRLRSDPYRVLRYRIQQQARQK